MANQSDKNHAYVVHHGLLNGTVVFTYRSIITKRQGVEVERCSHSNMEAVGLNFEQGGANTTRYCIRSLPSSVISIAIPNSAIIIIVMITVH